MPTEITAQPTITNKISKMEILTKAINKAELNYYNRAIDDESP